MGRLALKMEGAKSLGGVEVELPLAGGLTETIQPPMTVRILNLDQIGLVYGAGAALAASDHVRNVLKFELRDREEAGLADYVLRRLSETPVSYDGQRFQLHVSLAPTGDARNCASMESTVHGNPAFPDDAWCRLYRADMALAVNLFEAMAEGRIALAWQPVRNVDDPQTILYYECLLRTETFGASGADALSQSAGPVIEALERLGLVRALDRHVVARAIAELQIEPFRTLAVNVSALSLVDDGWWTELLAMLARMPRVARRLYIEVTETASFASVAEASELLGRLRCLGCKIVLDDFGMGHAAIRSILTLAPDVVKIDKFFVHNARATTAGRDALAHMIGLVESLGAVAIVEGVENETHARLAREAGAVWQQGYHHGRPSISRPWRLDTRVAITPPGLLPGSLTPGIRADFLDPGSAEAA